MRKMYLLSIVLLIAALMTSCEKHDRFERVKPEKMEKLVKSPLIEMAEWPADGCGLMTFDLIAGQNIYVGSVKAVIDDNTLFVKYEALKEDCEITEAHLFVGNMKAVIPAGQNGNPKIGHFPYFWEDQGSATEVVFSIDMEELGLDDCIKIAAHAVVKCPQGEETAWANGGVSEIFALKSKMDTDYKPDGSINWVITGLPGGWCDNFTYFSIAEALASPEPIDLVLYAGGKSILGRVTVVEDNGMYKFTISSNRVDGQVYRTHFFAGTIEGFLNQWTDCDAYRLFTTIDTPKGESIHEFEVPVSVPEGTEFDGSRWGWYVTYCPLCL